MELQSSGVLIPWSLLIMYDVGRKTFRVDIEQKSIDVVLTSDRTSADDGWYRRENLCVDVDRKIVFVVLIIDRSLANNGEISVKRLSCRS